MSLTSSVKHSLKWSFLGEVFGKTVGPLVFIILARLLVPEDFGVVAAATVVISFSHVFWDAGLAKALVQRQTNVSESANTVFWINFVLGAALFAILLLTADLIAAFFQDPRISPVVSVLALRIPLVALGSVHSALFQKNFYFKKLVWIKLLTISIPAAASIPLAMNGAGYWALVAGTLTGQVANTAALWLVSSWRPSLEFDRVLALELWRFGRWSMLTGLSVWLYLWMDAIVVGH